MNGDQHLTKADYWPCNGFDFGYLTGIKYTKNGWSSIGRKRLWNVCLPIRNTAICCSHIECKHQFASRTAINCPSRHVRWEPVESRQEWSATGSYVYVTEAELMTAPIINIRIDAKNGKSARVWIFWGRETAAGYVPPTSLDLSNGDCACHMARSVASNILDFDSEYVNQVSTRVWYVQAAMIVGPASKTLLLACVDQVRVCRIGYSPLQSLQL